ncbi:MAG: site-2 protease family protein [Elusimicrobiota bacterium]|nr:site-2 protease family protein [Elusimicrobiota bacterium]
MSSSFLTLLWSKFLWLISPDTLLSILGIAFALGLVIFIHELGHFLACRLLKIRVEEFSIGFGKILKKWQPGQTQYSLRAIPLGGYVKPAGEFYAREAEIKDEGEFAAKPWYSRAFMVFAGAGMNYVLAFVIFFIVVLSMGLPVSDPKAIPPVVGEIVAGYPASASTLEAGDKITEINKTPVQNWQELVQTVAASEGIINVAYERGGKTINTTMDLAGGKKLGIALEPVYEKASFFKAIYVAAHQCYYWTALSLKTIAEKLWQRQAPEVAGPIGIFEIVGKGVHSGAENYFFLIGLISVAIGMFNLFPIPILDGGHILFFIIEGIRGKRVKEKTILRATSFGAFLLIALVVYATYSDIARIANRSAKTPKAAVEATVNND